MICIKYVPHNFVNGTEEESQLVKISPTSITLSHTIWTASWLGFQYNPEIIFQITDWRTKSLRPKEFYVQKLRTKTMLPLLTDRVWSTNNLHLKEKQHWILSTGAGKVIKVGFDSEAESSTQGQLGPSARQRPCSSAHSIMTLKHFLAHCSVLMSLVIWLPCQLFIFSLPWTPTSKHKHFRTLRIWGKKITTELIFPLDTFKVCFVQLWEEHKNALQTKEITLEKIIQCSS